MYLDNFLLLHVVCPSLDTFVESKFNGGSITREGTRSQLVLYRLILH